MYYSETNLTGATQRFFSQSQNKFKTKDSFVLNLSWIG